MTYQNAHLKLMRVIAYILVSIILTPMSSSLIDVIGTSNTTLLEEAGVIETYVSDHFLVYMRVNLKLPKP